MRLSWMHASGSFGRKDLSLNRKEPFIGLPVGRSTIFHFVILVVTRSYSYLIVGVRNNREQGKPLKRNKQQYTTGYAADEKLRTAKLKAN